MDFSDALRHLKRGRAVSRSGWNGKGMYVYLQQGKEFPVEMGQALTNEVPIGSMAGMLPHVVMRTVDGTCVPWLCSQTDMLSNDWEIKFPGDV